MAPTSCARLLHDCADKVKSSALELVEWALPLRHCTGAVRLIDMREDERVQGGMFSYVSLEQRAPSDHPLREVRKVTDVVLHTLRPELDAPYAESYLRSNDCSINPKTYVISW
jgi:hypothetical protein